MIAFEDEQLVTNATNNTRTIATPTTIAAAILFMTPMLACATSGDARRGKNAAYDAEFATVYNAVLASLRDRYPRFAEDVANRTVRTARHPIRFANRADGNDRVRKYYARFDIVVSRDKPLHVTIRGHAYEWREGAVPVALTGAATPAWLQARVDALYAAIYHRLKRYDVTSCLLRSKNLASTRHKL